MSRQGLAPAKINLMLHVGPVAADGYHPLTSLVAFANVGDRITVEPAERLSLSVNGPFGGALAGERDNLVLRGLRALGEAAEIGEPPVAITLDKQLPIAAGLGGGSSDAGTAILLTAHLLGLDIDQAGLEAVAQVVGADGPMCLRARPAWATGIGNILKDEPRLPPLHAVLLNPGLASPTGAVYRDYDRAPQSADYAGPPQDWTPLGVIEWLRGQRNDLEPPALRVTPGIQAALDAMATQPDCLLTRMSGSGATVFGLFADQATAQAAAQRLARPGWWVRACILH
ncbi:4-(cytidine 5'-diphospho)-2-C-methyl-D-erythritol kinase [Brevundimonas vesicularis]|uniref:4-(cytidine 5'-diphospho)-2-C-methyl-D-erythritol kinase n=1 Tax=Brevundimonas vesicularis TaxID=41276 RepID=UPI0038D38BBE